jgi:preprotein translocase subunit SecD
LVQLQTDHESVSNQIFQANSAQALSRNQLGELLRLRGEVGVLRQQTNQLGSLRAENQQLRSQLTAAGSAPANLAVPPASPAPFQLRLVLDDSEEDAETMTNNLQAANGRAVPETLRVHKTPLMDFAAVQSANVSTDRSSGTSQIEIVLTEQGREQFASITKEHLNKRLAIAIDGKSYSAPVIRSEITGGKMQITGSFSEEEARNLADKINEAIRRPGS